MREKLKEVFSSTGFIVVVAFVVRLILLAAFYHYYAMPSVRDNLQFGAETGSVAAAIAAGRGFSSPLFKNPSGPTAWFTPIYPYLLAAIFKMFGTFSYTSGLLIRTIDIAVSAFTCWPIYAIGAKAFNKTTGKVGAWIWAFLPTAVYFSITWVWDTTIAGLFMAMLFAATLWLRGSDKMSWWLGYGVLWAVGALVNPSILSVLPFLALWAIWPLRHRLAHAAKLATMTSLIFCACISPWTIRNYVVFHKFIPLRSNFGLELWLGNNTEVPDTWSPFLHPNDNVEEARKYVRMTEIPYMEEKQRLGYEFMRTHPSDAARFALHRFADTWIGMWESPVDIWSTSSLYIKFIITWNCLFSLLALAGVLFAYRAKKEEAFPFAMVMLVFPLVFYFTHSSQRYRFPMDPIMQVLAAFAIVYPLSHLAGQFHSVSGGASRTPQMSAQGSD